MLKTRAFFLLSGMLWLALITYLLVMPGSNFPKEDWLDKIWFDKWVHIGLFAILTYLWCSAYQFNPAVFSVIAILCITYGIGMEFVQKHYVSNRGFEIMDIVADAIGAFIGFLFSRKKYGKK